MSGWALGAPGFTLLDRYDLSTTADYITTVTASGTPHTKGSWVELTASTSQDAYFIEVNLFNTFSATTNTGVLVDLGVGGSGSEVVLVENMLAGWHGTGAVTQFPIYIPAGVRLAARCQAVIASDTVDVGVRLSSSVRSFNRDQWQGGNVVTYGADAGNSRGTLVSAPASAHTKGSWTEIVASTTEPHSALAISVQGHSDTALSNATGLLDVGFGAGGSEQIVIADIMVKTISSEAVWADDTIVGLLAIGRTIPVGARLAARLQWSSGSNDHISLCIHGIT
jgi:hypothetical protein